MELFYKVLAFVSGAIFSGIFIPVFNHFIPRYYNNRKTSIRIAERQEGSYNIYVLVVENKSFATLKNLYVHITIDNDRNDIVKNTGFQIFCPDTKVDFGKLSWAQNVDGKIYPYIDINQGQIQDSNFVRLHNLNSGDTFIEVSSEQGFYNNNPNAPNSSRTVLRANKNYTFQVKLTGDNIAPKEIKILFNNEQRIFSLV